MENKQTIYDTLIVGCGIAGMTAALYCARANKSVLIIECKHIGGQITGSPNVENYPGFESISGGDLAVKIYEQISKYDLVNIELDKVVRIEKNNNDNIFIVNTEYKQFISKTIILATGVKQRTITTKTNNPILYGNGIHYCAVCDGVFYKDMDVGVVGGGHSAIQYALYLSKICKNVYMYIRDDFNNVENNQVQLLNNTTNIIICKNTEIIDCIGKSCLEEIIYKDKKNNNILNQKLSALFVAIGYKPDNFIYNNIVDIDSNGYIVANELCETKTLGVYAAGDCRQKQLRQLVTATSDGAIAATNIIKYLNNNKK